LEHIRICIIVVYVSYYVSYLSIKLLCQLFVRSQNNHQYDDGEVIKQMSYVQKVWNSNSELSILQQIANGSAPFQYHHVTYYLGIVS